MPEPLGNIIVLALWALAVFAAVRSLVKKEKRSGSCTGDCTKCGGCH